MRERHYIYLQVFFFSLFPLFSTVHVLVACGCEECVDCETVVIDLLAGWLGTECVYKYMQGTLWWSGRLSTPPLDFPWALNAFKHHSSTLCWVTHTRTQASFVIVVHNVRSEFIYLRNIYQKIVKENVNVCLVIGLTPILLPFYSSVWHFGFHNSHMSGKEEAKKKENERRTMMTMIIIITKAVTKIICTRAHTHTQTFTAH